LMLDLCDRVAFLVDGQVSAEGTHRELLRDSPGYRDVVIRGEEDR
jgi:ABC-type multidrug transport system ATPase subunit